MEGGLRQGGLARSTTRPPSRPGVQPGDLITHIDGQRSVRGMTLAEAVEQMRGKIGTPIKLTIRRADREPIDVTLTRDVIRPQVGALPPGGRRHRLHPPHLLQRADRRGRCAARSPELKKAGAGRAAGPGARPAQQPGRAARPGGRGLRRLPRPGRDRLDPRAQAGGRAALERPAGRHRPGPADRRADQRRLGLGLARSSPAPCRTTAAPSCSASSPSARASCRPSSRSPAMARCA